MGSKGGNNSENERNKLNSLFDDVEDEFDDEFDFGGSGSINNNDRITQRENVDMSNNVEEQESVVEEPKPQPRRRKLIIEGEEQPRNIQPKVEKKIDNDIDIKKEKSAQEIMEDFDLDDDFDKSNSKIYTMDQVTEQSIENAFLNDAEDSFDPDKIKEPKPQPKRNRKLIIEGEEQSKNIQSKNEEEEKPEVEEKKEEKQEIVEDKQTIKKQEEKGLFDVDDDELDDDLDIVGAQKEKNLGIENGEKSKQIETKLNEEVAEINKRNQMSPEERKVYDTQKKFKELFIDDEEKDKQKSSEIADDNFSINDVPDEPEAEDKEQSLGERQKAVDDKLKSLGIVNDNNSINDVSDEPEVENEEQDKTAPENKNLSFDTPEATKESYQKKLDAYNHFTGQEVGSNRLENLKDLTVADLKSNKNRNDIANDFKNNFKNLYKSELNNALTKNNQLREQGKPALSYAETLKQVDGMMRESFKYLQDSNIIDKKNEFPTLGGNSAQEIKDMQMNAYDTQAPGIKKDPAEKNDITKQFNENNTKQKNVTNDSFKKLVTGVNKFNGVNFSAKGIQTYLNTCWKEAGKGSQNIDEQREKFMKEYQNFNKKAFEKMTQGAHMTSDPAIMTKNFDIFSQNLDEVCKNNGWLDKNHEHKFMGGMNSKEIAEMQKKGMESKPKSFDDMANTIASEISNNQFAYGDVTNSMHNLAAEIPESKEGQLDNLAARKAVGVAKALEKQNAGHSKWWKFRHPILNHREKAAIDQIKASLENKGYKDVQEYFDKNPLKPEDDHVAKQRQEYENKIDEHQKQNELREKNPNQQITNNSNNSPEVNNENLGKRITVPEADNIKEIVDPEVKSPKVEPTVDKKLEISGPQTNTGK